MNKHLLTEEFSITRHRRQPLIRFSLKLPASQKVLQCHSDYPANQTQTAALSCLSRLHTSLQGETKADTYWSKRRRCSTWGHTDIFLSQNPLYRVQDGKCIPATVKGEDKHKPHSKEGTFFYVALSFTRFEMASSKECDQSVELVLMIECEWWPCRLCWGEQKVHQSGNQSMGRWRKTLRAIQNSSTMLLMLVAQTRLHYSTVHEDMLEHLCQHWGRVCVEVIQALQSWLMMSDR